MDPLFTKINEYLTDTQGVITLLPRLHFARYRVKYHNHNCQRMGKILTGPLTSDYGTDHYQPDSEFIIEFNYSGHVCNSKCNKQGTDKYRVHNELKKKGVIRGTYTRKTIYCDRENVEHSINWNESIELIYNAGYLPFAYVEGNKIKMNFVGENNSLWLCNKKSN